MSRDLNKSAPYGPVTFKLLVYPGIRNRLEKSATSVTILNVIYVIYIIRSNCLYVRSTLMNPWTDLPQILILELVRIS